MAVNRIQFQPGMSLFEFFERYGSEAQCEAALEQARWPQGFIGAIAYRFNRRFDLHALPARLLVAALRCEPCPLHRIRLAATSC